MPISPSKGIAVRVVARDPINGMIASKGIAQYCFLAKNHTEPISNTADEGLGLSAMIP